MLKGVLVLVGVMACSSPDGRDNDVEDGAPLECSPYSDAIVCVTFDDPSQDVMPFGFAGVIREGSGEGSTVPDDQGLALRLPNGAGVYQVIPGQLPASKYAIRFDVKSDNVTTGVIGEVRFETLLSMTFDIFPTLTGTELRLFTRTGQDAVMIFNTPPPIAGEWTRVEIDLSMSSGQIELTFSAHDREAPPSPKTATISVPPNANALETRMRLANGFRSPDLVDTFYFDNVLFTPLM